MEKVNEYLNNKLPTKPTNFLSTMLYTLDMCHSLSTMFYTFCLCHPRSVSKIRNNQTINQSNHSILLS